MSITRRGFISGFVAALVARKLPKPKPAPIPTVKWSQLVYGAPILYVPRKLVVFSIEDTIRPGAVLRIDSKERTS